MFHTWACQSVVKKPNFTVSPTAYGVRATSLVQSNAVQHRGMQINAATFSYTPKKPTRGVRTLLLAIGGLLERLFASLRIGAAQENLLPAGKSRPAQRHHAPLEGIFHFIRRRSYCLGQQNCELKMSWRCGPLILRAT